MGPCQIQQYFPCYRHCWKCGKTQSRCGHLIYPMTQNVVLVQTMQTSTEFITLARCKSSESKVGPLTLTFSHAVTHLAFNNLYGNKVHCKKGFKWNNALEKVCGIQKYVLEEYVMDQVLYEEKKKTTVGLRA